MWKHPVQICIPGLAIYFTKKSALNDDIARQARIAWALHAAHCSPDGSVPGLAWALRLVQAQHPDGGWSDIEETIYCLGNLATLKSGFGDCIYRGKVWLHSVRLPCGAWGRSERDRPRIPITALASALVPEVVTAEGLSWLANQWQADLESEVQLTYKGGFFLLSQKHPAAPRVDDLVSRTIAYLSAEQEEDGGFGPWKGHPVGSDPWTTGVVLWGLSAVPDKAPKDVIKKALAWLEATQLPNGLWPYHYIDDGSSMALIGISSVLPLLKEA